MAGAIGGCLCGIIAWLIYASQYPGGLYPDTFIKNTGEVTNLERKLQMNIFISKVPESRASYHEAKKYLDQRDQFER